MLIVATSLIVLVGCFAAVREQASIDDEQFLKSMIPHHASALLMCEQASLADPEIQRLCESIRRGPQAEIDRMNSILARSEKAGQ